MNFGETIIHASDTELSAFYQIELERYRFRDKIRNQYSREEAVRQWMIQEMISKLNYPEQMIEIEYPVRNLSGWECADIAVSRWNKEETEPYILIGIIQSKEDIDAAMRRLKSYMACTPTVRYAVVTDGWHISMEKMSGKTFVPVRELPVYEKKDHNRYWKYEYLNLKNKCRYEYRVDRECEEEIQIKQKGYEEILEYSSYCFVPIMGTVAAGSMKPAMQEYMGEIKLPEDFGVHKGECFALKVKGDSMTDFDILSGDYVVIRKQSYAKPGDIVIAGEMAEDEVTMKRYFLSGKSVMLMPGNRQYEPILLPVEETYINGVLIGIMKQVGE